MAEMDEPGTSKFSSAAAVSLKIGGVSVNFPAKPYPSQLSMMSMIIKGLQRKQHCLLESPTGSGKSLALLCSALAWQQASYNKQREEMLQAAEEEVACTCNKQEEKPGASVSGTSKYFSTENSEASVIDLCTPPEEDDFKQTSKCAQKASKARELELPLCPACISKKYKPKSECGKEKLMDDKPTKKIRVPKIWFGTRTHKQIGQIARELGRTYYDDVRMTILSSRQHSCIHPGVMKSSNKNEDCRELRKGTHKDMLGAKCAFYQNVHRMKNHHQLTCAGMGSAWDLEELVSLGKNIKACPYYSAKELVASANIIFCPYNYLIDPTIRTQMQINLNNQILILDEAHNIEDSARDAASFTLTEDSLGNTTADIDFLISDGVKVDDHRPLHLLCSKLGQWVSEHSRNLKTSDYETSSQVWSGRDIIKHLSEWGITQDTLPLLEQNYAAATDLGEEDIETARVLHSSSQATLSGLFNVLRYLMMDEYKFCEDYRVTIIKQATYGSLPPRRTRDGWISMHKRPKKHFVTNLHFWCLNPAVAFSDLSKAHSIILTSGTLSPMSSFSSELGLSFPIQLEANHVIQDSQVWVGSVGSGPNGIRLQATYQNTDKFSFQDELGAVVENVCNTVPHGILCFFSSYNMLKKLRERWEATGLWGRISETKTIVCEPRSSNKDEFDSLLQSFYDAVSESESEMDENSSLTGALLLAVCRGKVSEGLDFADNNARAVITVGIPFPSIKDKQVELKRKYNDMHKIQRGLLSGSEWYEIQAYRAMNQALGRCIRHKNDWGALIIVDDRFCKNPKKYCQGLSKWVRQKMHPHWSYQSAMASITAFVERQVYGKVKGFSAKAVSTETGAKLAEAPLVTTQVDESHLEQTETALIEKQRDLLSYFPQTGSSVKAELPKHNGTGSENECHFDNPERFLDDNTSVLAQTAKPVVCALSKNGHMDQVELSSDEDFRDTAKTPKASMRKNTRKTNNTGAAGKATRKKLGKVASHQKTNGTSGNVESECINGSLTDGIDKNDPLNFTIPASPEKNDVTIIPESPPSPANDRSHLELPGVKAAQCLFGSGVRNSKTPSRKRKTVDSHDHLSMPDSKRITDCSDEEITEDWDDYAKLSEEFPARASNRKRTGTQKVSWHKM